MVFEKDNSYNDIRYKSLMKWLDEIEKDENIAISGGVTLAREYIQHLLDENQSLRNENELKKKYMKKLMEK
ncbi:MAG: hypothetical protein K6G84_05190 [Lachnospiraceae bacterium]|nr:hypothetical protein [Lachnospiraceae bacterium]